MLLTSSDIVEAVSGEWVSSSSQSPSVDHRPAAPASPGSILEMHTLDSSMDLLPFNHMSTCAHYHWRSTVGICICITESLCCTAETNTTLLINYTSIKKKELEKHCSKAGVLNLGFICGNWKKIPTCSGHHNPTLLPPPPRASDLLILGEWTGQQKILNLSSRVSHMQPGLRTTAC